MTKRSFFNYSFGCNRILQFNKYLGAVMENNNEYDVIILGTGPAGASVASELSKDLKVLVFDKKETIEETTKSWLIPDMAITTGGAEEILPFMKNGVKRFLADTYQGVDVQWDAHLKYHFALEHELLGFWGKRITDNGSEILLDCWYQDSFITDTGVVVSTSKGDFKSKLLIDASGGHSPIRAKYALTNDWYWWSVCGAIVKFPNGLPEGMRVGDYQLWQTFRDTNLNPNESMSHGRPIWEYEILDDNTAFVFIFYLGKNRIPHEDMQKVFTQILREEEATSKFHDTIITEEKHGWYPSGGPHSQKVAGDRVTFIGTAGCWTSPCGWGVSFIVANYKNYAKRVIEAVNRDSLSQKDLDRLITLSTRSKYQVLLDQIATHFLSFATADQLNEFIRLFDPNGPLGDAGPMMCEKLFTLTITEHEAIDFLKKVVTGIGGRQLAQNIPKEDYLLLLELVGEGVEVAVVDAINKGLEFFRENKQSLHKDSAFSLTG